MALLTAGRPSVLTTIGRKLATGTLARRMSQAWRTITRLFLVITGLTLISVAGWEVSHALGLLAAGLSCLIVEWVVKG